MYTYYNKIHINFSHKITKFNLKETSDENVLSEIYIVKITIMMYYFG